MRDAFDAYFSLVDLYIKGLIENWGPRDFHASADTSFARRRFASWFEILPLAGWNAAIASRMRHEMHQRPASRKQHRYIPFPSSVIGTIDHFQEELIVKLALHNQLLTGTVLYLHDVEMTDKELRALDYCVVSRRTLLTSVGGQCRPIRPGFSRIDAADDASRIDDAFQRIWQVVTKEKGLCRLYYRFPYTFDSGRHYITDDVAELLLAVQGGYCPCPSRCNLRESGRWAIDHIVPRDDRGTNVLINLWATCPEFNSAIKREQCETRPPDYLAALSNAAPHAAIPVGYLSLLVNQRLDERGYTRYANRVVSFAKKMYGTTIAY